MILKIDTAISTFVVLKFRKSYYYYNINVTRFKKCLEKDHIKYSSVL